MVIKVAICPPRGIALRAMGRFAMLWADISRMGFVASDVVRGMCATQFIWVGQIATLKGFLCPFGLSLNPQINDRAKIH